MARLAGIFLIAAATLLFELSLTRIFSVTMWYYFAFLAVSLALFGLAVSGIAVHVLAEKLTRPRSAPHRAVAALGFAVTTPLALAVHLAVLPAAGDPDVFTLAVSYLAAATPFFCGGLCVSLALSHYPGEADRLYAADLGGAGLGAFAVVPLLHVIDGPGAMLVIGALGALAATAFAVEARAPRLAGLAGACLIALTAAAGLQARQPFFRIEWAKGHQEQGRVAESWSAYARLAAFDTDAPMAVDEWDMAFRTPHRRTIHAWGLSPRYDGPVPRQIVVNIDAAAATPITYRRDPGAVEHIVADISALAYAALEAPSVLLVGPGGGRDVIAALASGARQVVAVELNRDLVALVEDRFGAVSGRPYADPAVRLVIDDGRAYLARSPERYDLLMASMVDTWAASAAGAFTLSENALYTREAFDLYWERLVPDGLLSMTRWALTPPHETLRMVALAVDLLRRRGVENPSRHVFVARRSEDEIIPGVGVATLLMSPTPLSGDRLARLQAACARRGFEVLIAPGHAAPPPYAALLAAPDPQRFYVEYPYDVSPPDDDRPFFFHLLKPRDFWRGATGGPSTGVNGRALAILGRLLAVTGVLSVAFLVGPLLLTGRRGFRARGRFRFLGYFACLGLGFVLIELPLMQRFVLFLGHPIYALAVVLASLLVFGGAGAFLAGQLAGQRPRAALPVVIGALLLVTVAYRAGLPGLLAGLMGLSATAKVFAAALLLMPLGLLLGMPLPLALRHLARVPDGAPLVPWLWAVNGALSVFATVLSTTVAVGFGFSSALLLGQLAYAGALVLAVAFPATEPSG
jgi:hypothetical protein